MRSCLMESHGSGDRLTFNEIAVAGLIFDRGNHLKETI